MPCRGSGRRRASGDTASRSEPPVHCRAHGELLKRQDLRIISCHLGGSSSICAIDQGKSVANSFGTTPQSGLPHNNRVGDIDPYALLKALPKFKLTFEQALDAMAKQGGLLASAA